jgi:hypothetical protein
MFRVVRGAGRSELVDPFPGRSLSVLTDVDATITARPSSAGQ